MGKLITVTGGARSGKSSFAESLCKDFKSSVLYVATSIPFDDEMKDRIYKHQMQRPENFYTLEKYKNLDFEIKNSIKTEKAVLIDCITIMITNLMLEKEIDFNNCSIDQINSIEAEILNEIEKIILLKNEIDATIICVTNELGSGIVPQSRFSRVFRDIAGRANQKLAESSNEVYFVVSGIAVKIKGE